jgi:hypothetical protein
MIFGQSFDYFGSEFREPVGLFSASCLYFAAMPEETKTAQGQQT